MRILELWRYPIKSVGGERLATAEVSELGLDGDRSWGLVDNQTTMVLTARREPRLLHASATLVDGRPVTVTSDGRTLLDSDDYTEWLGTPVTLTPAGPDSGTYEAPLDAANDADWVSWQGAADAWHDSERARVSLVSTGSLGQWDARRFRSNIVLEGSGEDGLIGQEIAIGSVSLQINNGIERCVMVTRPQPGIERDLQVLKTINTDRGSRLCIGATITAPGQLSEGDLLAIVGQ